MQITFNLLHVFNPGSSLDVDTDAVRILRECQTRLSRAQSRNGIATALYRIDGHCVVWDIPFAFFDGASEEVNAWCLKSLLDCLIACNTIYLARMKAAGTRVPGLYETPVYYRRTVVWDAIPAMYSMGFGDCKSLTAALVAQYRSNGIQCSPVFRFLPPKTPDEVMLFHILVNAGATGFEDPSKVKGMGAEYQPFVGR